MKSPGPFPDVVEIVVEIPRGSRNKYEYDEVAKVYRLDRVLSSAVFYNFDYGFIEGTRAGDGDHTDALLIIDEPTFTGCHVWARPIGGLEMRDEKGFDFKVLCVALGDAHQQHIERLEQVRPHRLVEIEHFFQTYKALEDKTVEMIGWREHDRALEVLRADRVDLAAGGRRGRGVVTDGPPPRRPRYPGEGEPGRRIFVAAPLPADAVEAIAALVDRVRSRRRPRRRPRRPLGPPRWPAPDPALPRPDARPTDRARARGRADRPGARASGLRPGPGDRRRVPGGRATADPVGRRRRGCGRPGRARVARWTAPWSTPAGRPRPGRSRPT